MKPFPYQFEDLDAIDRFNGRPLIAWEMGLGKTLEALWWMQRHPEALPAVVVCPASVKHHWEHETLHNLDAGIRPLVLEGHPAKGSRFKPEADLVIVNYDVLGSRRSKNGEGHQGWLSRLRGIKPKTIVLDECQFISNRSKRTRAVQSLCKGVPYVLALSGTPLRNRPIDLFNTLQILRPDKFPSRWNYAHAYCAPQWTLWGWKFDGASHLDQLNKKLLETCMVRRRKSEVLSQLPELSRRVVTLPLDGEAEYRRARDSFLAWLAEQKPGKLRGALRAQAVVKVGYLRRLACRLKLRHAVRWVNELLEQTDEKLVLFAIHKRCIDVLQRRCKADSVTVDGSVAVRKRKGLVEQFRDDPGTRLFIGNIQAAGVGLDGLQHAAGAVAFVELPWSPADVDQAESRLHRIGAKGRVDSWMLVAFNTIEEKICQLIQTKAATLAAVLDGGSGDDLPLFDELMREMKR